MTRIMHSAAEVVPMLLLLKKKSGTPTSAADPKHTSCRFVSPNSIYQTNNAYSALVRQAKLEKEVRAIAEKNGKTGKRAARRKA